MNDTHTEDYGKPDLFPQTETRHVSELFAPSPADAEALERRDAARRAAQYANEQLRSRPVVAGIAAIEQALREPEPEQGTLDALLVERNQRHGEFTDDAKVSQRLKLVMRDAKNWDHLAHIQREALEHIAVKIGRILSGDPNHKDHWEDIQGYARLVEERL